MNSEGRDRMEPNSRKTTGVRRLGNIDIRALREAVLQVPESVWVSENEGKPNKFVALDSTQHVVFRFVTSLFDWRESHDRPLWAGWKSLLEPVMMAATGPYGYARGDFPRVMLARMAPGGIIKPHQDTNPAAKWPHKIHVPLTTNPDVTFYVSGTGYHFPEGECVEVNNMGVHGVANRGETSRIHLIFEYYDMDQPAPAWVNEIAKQQAQTLGS